ncbi:MAG: right-handed parallel beta-helix repeat-containing protein [Anaerolineae bacterium]|nr:right-handed parallel beta-helix repeat-containing protein [Anaerolineae bacterium]
MNWLALFLLITAPMRIYESTTLPPNRTYNQPVYIMADNITLDCRGSAFVGNKIGVGLLIQNRKGVTIRNCKFHNWDVGGYVVSGNRFVFENNDFSNNYLDDNSNVEHLKPIPHGGLILNGIQNSRVVGNKANNNVAGIQILNSSRITVERNTTSHNRGWGIYLYGTTSSQIISNTVEYCNRSCPEWGKDAGCGAAGIVLTMQSDRNKIGWNQLHHNGNGIYKGNLPETASNDNEMMYNTISNSVANGIEATFSFRNYIHHNTMTNDNYGAWLGYAQYVRFEYNVIKGARVNSVEHHNAQFSTYIGNTFEGADVLLKPHADPQYQPVEGRCQGNQFDKSNQLINAKFISTGCK